MGVKAIQWAIGPILLAKGGWYVLGTWPPFRSRVFTVAGRNRCGPLGEAIAGAAQRLARFHPRMVLCTYHLLEDAIEIPRRVRQAWAGYTASRGLCNVGPDRLRPEVVFFQ